MADHIAAIDQGTTSTRFILFDRDGRDRARSTSASTSRSSRGPGWVEHDAEEIWQRTREVIGGALASCRRSRPPTSRRSGSPTSARRRSSGTGATGEPVHNAIVWQDTRTEPLVRELGRRRRRRPPARRDRPAAVHLLLRARRSRWILDHVPGARERAPRRGELAFGTIDTLAAVEPHRRAPTAACTSTDVTNASRTLLMDLRTLDWHEPSLELMGIPRAMLPEIRSLERALRRGARHGASAGVPVAGILGDQQAALFGQTCFEAGRGEEHLRHRLLPARSTPATEIVALRQAADERRLPARRRAARATCSRARSPSPARSCSGCATSLGIIRSAAEVEDARARRVDDNGGVYFVPAFSGPVRARTGATTRAA